MGPSVLIGTDDEQGENREYYTKEHFDDLRTSETVELRSQTKQSVVQRHSSSRSDMYLMHYLPFLSTGRTVAKTTVSADGRKLPKAGEGEARGVDGAWRCGWGKISKKPSRTRNGDVQCAEIFVTVRDNCLRHKRHLFPRSN